MNRRTQLSPGLVALAFVAAAGLGRRALAEEAAPAPPPAEAPAQSPVDALVAVIETIQSDPAALASAGEAVAKKIEELKAASAAAAGDAEAKTAAVAEKTAKVAELKAAVEALAKQMEEAKAQAAALEGELPGLNDAVAAAKAAQADSASKIATMERAAELVKALAAAAQPPPAEAAAAPAEAAAAPAEPAKEMSAEAKEAAMAAPAITPEIEKFFEEKIRPVLAESCFSCHGPEKQKSDLRLDSREAALKGGAEGPGIVPGDPDKSLLVQAIRYDTDLLMPPDAKLSDEAIAALTEWVKMGAPWPAPKDAPAESAAADPKGHWAFRPVADPAPPEVADAGWAKTNLDKFVLAKLEAAGIAPGPEADRRTLIRRAYVDLTGLQPSAEEVAAFVADSDPRAYENLIDRLLASPRYGERWGRHWLDVARYADTKGYVFQQERQYAYSHTYRDYVIRAFNEDKPYDRFVMEQIAADRLDLGEDKSPLAAMGFLTLGRRFLNNPHDIADDRIDVVTRGLQALTVSCARCHDHKYDPIPTEDYYALHGIFTSSTEPAELPLIGEPTPGPLYDEFLAKKAELEAETNRYFRAKHAEFLTRERPRAADYLLVAHKAILANSDDELTRLAQEKGLSHYLVRRWMDHLKKTAETHDPVMGAWQAFAKTPPEIFAAAVEGIRAKIVANDDPEKPLNPAVAAAFAGEEPVASIEDAASRYGRVFARIDGAWAEALKTHAQMSAIVGPERVGPAPTALPDANDEAVRVAIYGPDGPASIPEGLVENLMTLEEQAQLRNRRLASDAHEAKHPGRPPRAQVLVDKDDPKDSFVFIRGNAGNRGDRVPRRWLEVLGGPDRPAFENGSGRLELAQSIANRGNPLTARVLVNRVWMHHFGQAIVPTVSDFGLRSDPPSHPELLDWLATRFMDDDAWSLKSLHRRIMLSATYRQASREDAIGFEKDPTNALLWTYNRRRLDYEALRDSLLQVAGRLDETMGGPSVEIAETASPAPRRTVYGFVDRQNLPGELRTFDFASPDAHSPKRFETTVPQQALWLLNNPFAIAQARAVAEASAANAPEAADAVRALYRRVYGREPDAEELELSAEFVATADASGPDPGPWRYGYGKVDAENGAVVFQPFPHFAGRHWSGGERMPDEALGWASLTAKGGHPGDDERAAIRRWIAPRAGTVEIVNAVSHRSDKGNGIVARIVGPAGEVAAWPVHNAAVEHTVRLQVEAGQAVDFLAESAGDTGFDSFEWAPVVRVVEERAAATEIADGPREWNAGVEFAGPLPEPLDPLGQLAQALLVSNEFAFVD